MLFYFLTDSIIIITWLLIILLCFFAFDLVVVGSKDLLLAEFKEPLRCRSTVLNLVHSQAMLLSAQLFVARLSVVVDHEEYLKRGLITTG